MDLTPSMNALFFGLLSAFALILGFILSRFWTPKPKISAALMAFGGGALLAALTLDLVNEALEKKHFLPLFIGCIAGGVLYVLLNALINSKGGFLRKTSTTISHIRKKNAKHYDTVITAFSQIPAFHRIRPDHIKALLPHLIHKKYSKGTKIITQGHSGNQLFIIEKGEVILIDEQDNNKETARLKDHEIFGELFLLTENKHPLSVVATAETKVWILPKDDFLHLLEESQEEVDVSNKNTEEIHKEFRPVSENEKAKSVAWSIEARASGHMHHAPLTPAIVKKHNEEHSSAPAAIFMGMTLDGIPESIVLGASLAIPNATISWSLLAGLFLSNFPEALSSSVGMKQNKMPAMKIFIMFASLFIISGLCSYFGNIFFAGASPTMFVLFQGIAAGAMLTMVAETMLPEAFHLGGNITGLSTLAGFLAAIAAKLFE
ncbi:MAG: cyclic nucleotide-binding domain-containing protein [Bacteroidota bacterium]